MFFYIPGGGGFQPWRVGLLGCHLSFSWLAGDTIIQTVIPYILCPIELTTIFSSTIQFSSMCFCVSEPSNFTACAWEVTLFSRRFHSKYRKLEGAGSSATIRADGQSLAKVMLTNPIGEGYSQPTRTPTRPSPKKGSPGGLGLRGGFMNTIGFGRSVGPPCGSGLFEPLISEGRYVGGTCKGGPIRWTTHDSGRNFLESTEKKIGKQKHQENIWKYTVSCCRVEVAFLFSIFGNILIYVSCLLNKTNLILCLIGGFWHAENRKVVIPRFSKRCKMKPSKSVAESTANGIQCWHRYLRRWVIPKEKALSKRRDRRCCCKLTVHLL